MEFNSEPTDPLDALGDPLEDTIIVTIIQDKDKPIRIESNAIVESDLLGCLIKATVAACLDGLISEQADDHETGESN